MLYKQKHETVLKRILFDFYSDSELCAQLALKGGTCLYLFHGLDRFSTDLYFNLLSQDLDFDKLTKILEKHLELADAEQKKHTIFWLGSFEKGAQKVKIEIGKRDYPDQYEHQDLLGLTIKTMTLPCMFAHKLCAITNRKQMANRDIYDAWFLFKKNTPFLEEIITLRTNKSVKEYFQTLTEYITKNIVPQGILQGLGEVLDDEQKIWAKENLVKELIFELKIH